jgi:Rrf2 family protein
MSELRPTVILALHALHAMMVNRKPVRIHGISISSGFAIDRVHQVIQKLRNSELVESRPGRGFVLSKAPGEISIQAVVCAIEEPMAPKAPCGGDFDACSSRAACILAPLCRNAGQSYQEALRSFTLAELMSVPLDIPNCLDPKTRLEAS